jgi:hypothetical protein
MRLVSWANKTKKRLAESGDTSGISGIFKDICSEIQRQKSFEKFLLICY